MPTNINFDKKLGFVNGTKIILPSGFATDFSTRSLSFDGVDEYMSTGSTYSELDGQTKATFSLWIKPTTNAAVRNIFHIGNGATSGINGVCQLWMLQGNRIDFSIDTGSYYGRANISAINFDAWNHILIAIDLDSTDEFKCYVNGSDATTSDNLSSRTSFSTATESLLIGEMGTGLYDPFLGSIDEFAIWSGQDLRNDVSTIYNNGKPADLTSLNPTSWYRAGESSTFAYPQILMPENTNKDKVSKYSFAFDGLGYVDCGDPDEFSFTSGKADSRFSISAWVYMNDATQFRIASKMLTNATAEYAFFTSAADQLNFVLYTNNTSNRISRYTSATLTSYEGQWIHLAATYDGSGSSTGLKIYLNGNRVDDTTSNVGVYAAMLNTNAPLTIGRAFQSNANGKIDEAAVFPIELAQPDVQAIYNNGVPNDISSYSPVGYWKLGEEAKFTDNWLVPNSALSNFSKYSFNFDGQDDYISIGTNSLGITSAITVSAWVKIPTTNTGGGGVNIQVIACEDTTNGGQRNWNLYWRGGTSNYFAWIIWNSNGASTTVTTTGITPNDGQWHHILATYDGTSNANGIKLYIDGGTPFTGTASSTGIFSAVGSETTIGALTGGGSWRFEGNIDEVAIWDSELSSGAVTSIYNGGKPKDLSGLSPLSWWRMGEEATYDAGTSQFTIPDQGSGGNTGTSSNTMLLETLVGDTAQYYGGGISDSMDIFDRVGDAPVFTNNFSLNFDGIDDSFSFSQISKSGVFSLSYWFKFTGTFNLNANCFVWGINNSNSSFIKLQTSTQVILKLDGTTYTINESGGNNIPQNTWANFTLVRNASNSVQLYLNGNVFGSSITSSNTFTINSFGRIINSSFGFLGYIDEVAYFESELSTSDVTSIYNSGIPNDISSISGLVSWWRFEEGSGTIAKDSGSGGNDGTLTNGPLYDTDRILATKANNTVSFNMEEADIVEDTP